MNAFGSRALILLFSIFINCIVSGENSTKYFRHIEFEDREVITGKYSVDSKNADNINCYRFTYNEQNILTLVEFIVNGQPAFDSLYRFSKITIEYEDSLEVLTFLNNDGENASNVNGVYKTKRIYNKKDNTVLITNLDNQNNIIEDTWGIYQYLSLLSGLF